MFESSPFKVILPVGVAQVVGLDEEVLPIKGIAFTTTDVVDATEVHPLIISFTTRLYVPAAAVVTLLMKGFDNVLVKPFGPDHA